MKPNVRPDENLWHPFVIVTRPRISAISLKFAPQAEISTEMSRYIMVFTFLIQEWDWMVGVFAPMTGST
jgi:hypothetical protein